MGKIISFLLLLIVFSNGLWSQSPPGNYSRTSLSYLMIDNAERNPQYKNWQQEYMKALNLNLSGKFDHNPLSNRFISPYRLDKQAIKRELEQSGYSTELMGYWWSRKEDGTMSSRLVEQRSEYNASADLIVTGDDRMIGRSAVHNEGEKLISKSKILVFYFHDILTQEEYYDQEDARRYKAARENGEKFERVARDERGYQGKITIFTYTLQYNDSIKNLLYEDLWLDESTPEAERKALKERFDNFQFPVVYESSRTYTVKGLQDKEPKDIFGNPVAMLTEKQLMFKLFKNGWSSQGERLDKATRVYASLFGVDPPRIKIGKKEGLTTDTRYMVFEFKEKANGKKVKKRKGVIRASNKIVDNRSVANLQIQPTEFYQISGQKLGKGMLVEERKQMGYFGTLWVGGGSYGGLQLTGGVNLSYMAGKKGTNLPPGIIGYGKYGMSGGNGHLYQRLGLGLGKDVYLMRNLFLTPTVEYLFEGHYYGNNDTPIGSTKGPAAGLGFSYHIAHYLMIGFNGILYYATDGDRRGGAIDFGLRINI